MSFVCCVHVLTVAMSKTSSRAPTPETNSNQLCESSEAPIEDCESSCDPNSDTDYVSDSCESLFSQSPSRKALRLTLHRAPRCADTCPVEARDSAETHVSDSNSAQVEQSPPRKAPRGTLRRANPLAAMGVTLYSLGVECSTPTLKLVWNFHTNFR